MRYQILFSTFLSLASKILDECNAFSVVILVCYSYITTMKSLLITWNVFLCMSGKKKKNSRI